VGWGGLGLGEDVAECWVSCFKKKKESLCNEMMGMAFPLGSIEKGKPGKERKWRRWGVEEGAALVIL